MFGELSPLLTGIVVFVVLAASIIVVVSLALSHRGIHLPHLPHLPTHHKSSDYALPAGADAALWSIVEAAPDPRNHLALTRDLSGEVHLTTADREAVAALYADGPTKQRIASAPEPSRAQSTPGGEPDEGFRIWARDDDDEVDTASDDLIRTSELFFAGEPRLNRF